MTLHVSPQTRRVFYLSLPIFAELLLQLLVGNMDQFMISHFGSAAVASIGNGNQVMNVVIIVLETMSAATTILLTQHIGAGKTGDACNEIATVGTAVSAVFSLGMGLLLLLAPEVLFTLLRTPAESFSGACLYTRIVGGAVLLQGLYIELCAVLRSYTLLREVVSVSVVMNLLNIMGNAILINGFFGLPRMGVAGAAVATLISQVLSGFLCLGYVLFRVPALTPSQHDLRPDRALFRRIFSVSAMTSIQQSIMNFGILCVQSLVNSFGLAAMAAFTAGVKIDSLAYSPAQDFGNGFATFVAQNQGANQPQRLRHGIRTAFLLSGGFCLIVSALVAIFAEPLLLVFLKNASAESLSIGVTYLRTEGLCYIGIGFLFLLYAIFRGLEQAGMSIVLTVLSLGLRVVLSYAFAPHFGMMAIWLAIPAGWLIADIVGFVAMGRRGLMRSASNKTGKSAC